MRHWLELRVDPGPRVILQVCGRAVLVTVVPIGSDLSYLVGGWCLLRNRLKLTTRRSPGLPCDFYLDYLVGSTGALGGLSACAVTFYYSCHGFATVQTPS